MGLVCVNRCRQHYSGACKTLLNLLYCAFNITTIELITAWHGMWR
jgi:hypothetical protein